MIARTAPAAAPAKTCIAVCLICFAALEGFRAFLWLEAFFFAGVAARVLFVFVDCLVAIVDCLVAIAILLSEQSSQSSAPCQTVREPSLFARQQVSRPSGSSILLNNFP
jgi:hypothetical protein